MREAFDPGVHLSRALQLLGDIQEGKTYRTCGSKRPRMSIAVIAGNLAFSPSREVPLTSLLRTQFFTL